MSHIHIDSKSIEEDVIQNQTRSMSERHGSDIDLEILEIG